MLPRRGSSQAVERLEEILTTPGVDGFMIGPADLSNAFGFPGDFANPEVERMIENILERSRPLDKIACYAPAPADQCNRRLTQGFRMVCLGSDINFLRWGAQQALSVMGRSLYDPRKATWKPPEAH